jgi:hypothetical protein
VEKTVAWLRHVLDTVGASKMQLNGRVAKPRTTTAEKLLSTKGRYLSLRTPSGTFLGVEQQRANSILEAMGKGSSTAS